MTNGAICRTVLISPAVSAAPEGTFGCGGVIMPSKLPLCTDSSSHAELRTSQQRILLRRSACLLAVGYRAEAPSGPIWGSTWPGVGAARSPNTCGVGRLTSSWTVPICAPSSRARAGVLLYGQSGRLAGPAGVMSDGLQACDP